MTRLRTIQMLGAAKAGGAETFFIRLVHALAEHPDVDLLPVVKTGSWASDELSRRNIPHQTAPFGSFSDRYLTRRTARRMNDIAHAFKPHVIQSWMNRATIFVPQGDWATVARLGGYYDMKYYRGHVAHLMGITDDLCKYFVGQGWPKENTHFLGNFAVEPRQDWRARRSDIRRSYSIPESATVLLLAGRLHRVKGVDLTLEALSRLPKNVWVIAAGSGPEQEALRTLAEKLGVQDRVVFTGWVNDITVPAAATDIWLAPSRWEPMGNTVLDAWAHGLPLIASRAAGPASLIHDGKTGLLVDVGDVASLQQSIEKLLDNQDLQASLAAAGRAHYLKHHSKDVIVDAYIDYYRSLINTPAEW